MFFLPNSKIEVFIPTKYFKRKNFDNLNLEYIGLKPDIPLDDNQDALEYVLNYLS